MKALHLLQVALIISHVCVHGWSPCTMKTHVGVAVSQKQQLAATRIRDVEEQNASRRQFLTALGAALVLPALPQRGEAVGDLFEFRQYSGFAKQMTVRVPDVEASALFFVEGLGAQVLHSELNDGINTTFIGFGPEELEQPQGFAPGVSSFSSYGGHFTVALVGRDNAKSAAAGPLDYYDPGNGLQYLQLAPQGYRISSVIAAGGRVLSGYGFLEVEAPGGLRLLVEAGERRDPFMFAAIKVKDLRRSVKWYTDVLGMKQAPYPRARPAADSPFEPEQPKGSVFLAFEPNAFGLLLIPAARGESLNVGALYGGVTLYMDDAAAAVARSGASSGNTTPERRGTVVLDPDGYAVELMQYNNPKALK